MLTILFTTTNTNRILLENKHHEPLSDIAWLIKPLKYHGSQFDRSSCHVSLVGKYISPYLT